MNTPSLLERLRDDHGRIAAMLRRLARAGDALGGMEDEAAWRELSDCLSYLEHYADHAHHPLEDRIFDLVLHKGLTPTERHLVFRNLGQHQELIGRTEELHKAADAALKGGATDVNDYVEALGTYLEVQRRHMTFEEMHIFPLLEARLDNADWNSLQAALDDFDTTTEVGGSPS